MIKFGIANKGYIFKKDRMLIIYKTEGEAANDPNPNLRIDQPGGRLEFGEKPKESLEREILEEVGLRIKIIKPIDVWTYVKEKDEFQLVGINYLCEWLDGEVVLSPEHEKFEWLTLDEIRNKKLDDEEEYIRAFVEWDSYAK